MVYKTRTASVSKRMRRKRKKSNTVSPNTVYGPAANKAFTVLVIRTGRLAKSVSTFKPVNTKWNIG